MLKESWQGQSKEKGGRFQPRVPATEPKTLWRPAWRSTALFCTEESRPTGSWHCAALTVLPWASAHGSSVLPGEPGVYGRPHEECPSHSSCPHMSQCLTHLKKNQFLLALFKKLLFEVLSHNQSLSPNFFTDKRQKFTSDSGRHCQSHFIKWNCGFWEGLIRRKINKNFHIIKTLWL